MTDKREELSQGKGCRHTDPEFSPAHLGFLLQAKVFVDSRTHKELTFDFAVTFGFFLDTYYDKRNSKTQAGDYPIGPGTVGQAKELLWRQSRLQQESTLRVRNSLRLDGIRCCSLPCSSR